MHTVSSVALGLLCGLIGALPQAYVLEHVRTGRRNASIALGLLSAIVTFVMLVCCLFVVWCVAPTQALSFGLALVFAYLTFWVIEALRAWKDAQQG